MKHVLVVWILSFGACACACTDREGDKNADAPSRAELVGTVLDRATGAPIEGALVRLPDGSETRTDALGRFAVSDLTPGLAGEVHARAENGREGRVTLRPLEPGRLEVVLHLGR